MANVAGLGDINCTTAGNFTLVHSGVTLPVSTTAWVEYFTTEFERLTPIAERHNFWGNKVILDGSFPAQIWRHEFTLFTETGSLGGFFEAMLSLHDRIEGLPRPLTINDGDTTTIIYNFGECYLVSAEPEEPSEFNKFKTGLIRASFVGNTRPTVT